MNYENQKTGESANVPWTKAEAVAYGYKRYMDETGCPTCGKSPVGRYIDGDVCVVCAENDAKTIWPLWVMGSPDRPVKFAISRERAVALGADSYYRERLCSNGPHFTQPHIRTGRCVRCEAERNKQSGPMVEFPNMIISRDEAAAIGWATYRTGDPCKRGHITWRYVSNGGCIDCMSAKPATFEKLDPDKFFSIVDQLHLFIGYAWDGKRIIDSRGKKFTPPQFNIIIGPGRYEVSGWRPEVTKPFDAFMRNFGPDREG